MGSEKLSARRGDPGLERPVKLAEQVASRIEEKIFSENLPVGHRLGRESDLNAAMGISRWPFREALSLLEECGLIELRRGVTGGIFVSGAALDVVCNRLSSYLEFVWVDQGEIAHVFGILLRMVTERSMPLLDAMAREEIQRLNTMTAEPSSEGFEAISEVWSVMTAAIGNPALTLFNGTLVKMLSHAAWYSTLEDSDFYDLLGGTSKANHDAIAAVLAGNLAAVRAATDIVMQGFDRLFEASSATGHRPDREGSPERAYRLHPPSRPAKKAEQVAREISGRIRDGSWAEGALLGGERDLMARFGVGRSVIREAIRSLERLGVVTMGRGGASGLKVMAPDPASVIAVSALYLKRENLGPAQTVEIRAILENLRHPDHRGAIAELFEAVLASATCA